MTTVQSEVDRLRARIADLEACWAESDRKLVEAQREARDAVVELQRLKEPPPPPRPAIEIPKCWNPSPARSEAPMTKSEARAILRDAGIDPAQAVRQLRERLAQRLGDPCQCGAEGLMPGHMAQVRAGQVHTRKRCGPESEAEVIVRDDHIAQLQAELSAAVEARDLWAKQANHSSEWAHDLVAELANERKATAETLQQAEEDRRKLTAERDEYERRWDAALSHCTHETVDLTDDRQAVVCVKCEEVWEVPALRELTAERDKLAAFKAYVHKRMDDAGVPADPNPRWNEDTGCRIGARLDYVEAEGGRYRAALVEIADGDDDPQAAGKARAALEGR